VKGRLTATTTPARRVFRGRTLADVSVAGGSKEEGLTVIRMLPVFLCLIGMRTSVADKLFIGWFGPRGLATIVFAVLVLDEKLPGNDHTNAGGRLDRLAPCYRARRNCESAGEEDGEALTSRRRGRCSSYQVRMKPMSPGIPPGYSRTSAFSPNPSGRR
jgi:hypothetical protein